MDPIKHIIPLNETLWLSLGSRLTIKRMLWLLRWLSFVKQKMTANYLRLVKKSWQI